MYLYDDDIEREYMTLFGALKCLPGVMPRKAKELIEMAESDRNNRMIVDTGLEKKEYPYVIGNTQLTEAEYKEFWIETFTFYGSTIRTSPKGAYFLLKIYQNGDFPMRKGALVTNAPLLQEYIDREKEFEDRFAKAQRARERHKYLVEHPGEIKESDFEYKLLDDLFFKHCGPANHTSQKMNLDGIEVSKFVTGYRSNSGKSIDYLVVISWVGSDGELHRITKDSLYSENRRNDADRNWGLPE